MKANPHYLHFISQQIIKNLFYFREFNGQANSVLTKVYSKLSNQQHTGKIYICNEINLILFLFYKSVISLFLCINSQKCLKHDLNTNKFLFRDSNISKQRGNSRAHFLTLGTRIVKLLEYWNVNHIKDSSTNNSTVNCIWCQKLSDKCVATG